MNVDEEAVCTPALPPPLVELSWDGKGMECDACKCCLLLDPEEGFISCGNVKGVVIWR